MAPRHFPSFPVNFPSISRHLPSFPVISRHFPSFPVISRHIPSYPVISHHFPFISSESKQFNYTHERCRGASFTYKLLYLQTKSRKNKHLEPLKRLLIWTRIWRERPLNVSHIHESKNGNLFHKILDSEYLFKIPEDKCIAASQPSFTYYPGLV